MRVDVRASVRFAAALATMVVLVGVPFMVVRLVGVPVPTADEWRMVWRTRQMDSGFVVHAGLMLVGVLWLWFACTACAEMVHLARAGRRCAVTSAVGDIEGTGTRGPARLVRRWVRFIALSSAVATGSVVMIGSGGHGEHSSLSVATPAATSAPMHTAPPTASSTTAAPSTAVSGETRSGVDPWLELAGLSVLTTGAVLAVQRRRRHRLRSAGRDVRVAPPTVDQARFEAALHATAPMEGVARLDHATRMASALLASSDARVVAARLWPDGTVRLLLSTAAAPDDPRWRVDGDGVEWVLPASADVARRDGLPLEHSSPTPLLVSLGVDPSGAECFVDVGAMGTLVIESSRSDEILRMIATSFTLSPFMDHGTVLTVGVGDVPTAEHVVEPCGSAGEAMARALSVVDEPVVVVAASGAGSTPAEAWPDAATCRRQFALGVVADAGAANFRLAECGEGHVLEPWGWRLTVPVLPVAVVHELTSLLEAAEQPLERIAPVVPIETSDRRAGAPEPQWQFLVRLLGQVDVVSADGESVRFDRSKSLELVVWLSLHRERPTRSKARAALWDTEVTAATFSNVVSDARRSMARVVPPPEDDEWIARTLTEELSMHELIVTDADVLAARVDAALRLPSFEAIEMLRPGVELITGLPFESSSFMWPDAEGHTSALVLLATDAATELAGHYLVLGDIDGVFWATGQGLKVLSGHEELIAMRMRAHAARGDRSGVRHEWESYERALAADAWSAADPSPKLVALRAELLTSDTWPSSSRAATA